MQNTNGTEAVAPSENLIRQLNNPPTAEALSYLLQHAQLLAFLVAGLDGVLKRSEELTDNIGATVRELHSGATGADLATLTTQLPQLLQALPGLIKAGTKVSAITDTKEFDDLVNKQNLTALMQAVNQMNQPQTLQALEQITQHAPLMALMLNSVDGLLRRSDQLADNLASSLKELNPALDLPFSAAEISVLAQQIPELLRRLPMLLRVGNKVAEVTDSEEFDAFLHGGMFEPRTVKFMGEVGVTVVEAQERFRKNPQQVTLFGLIGSMKDPDVQRGMGFLVELSRSFGKMMAKHA